MVYGGVAQSISEFLGVPVSSYRSDPFRSAVRRPNEDRVPPTANGPTLPTIEPTEAYIYRVQSAEAAALHPQANFARVIGFTVTVTAADTPENRKVFLQNPSQKEGLGFSIIRGVSLISMAIAVPKAVVS